MHQCACGAIYEHSLQSLGCAKAGHYQRTNSNNNQVIPNQYQQARSRTQSNSSLTVLLKVVEHQQFLMDITKELISGSATEVQWVQKIQEKTSVLINEVQQIKL